MFTHVVTNCTLCMCLPLWHQFNRELFIIIIASQRQWHFFSLISLQIYRHIYLQQVNIHGLLAALVIAVHDNYGGRRYHLDNYPSTIACWHSLLQTVAIPKLYRISRLVRDLQAGTCSLTLLQWNLQEPLALTHSHVLQLFGAADLSSTGPVWLLSSPTLWAYL